MLHDSGEIVFDHDNLVLTFPRGHTSRVMTAVTIIQLNISCQYILMKLELYLMFHDCRSERKLWASATVNRADPMLSRTSSENPSDPSLRAASEKNSSSSYSLEIITALR